MSNYRRAVINSAVASVVSHQRQLVAAMAKVGADVALEGEGMDLLSPDEQTEIVEALKAGTLPYLDDDGSVCEAGACQRCGE